jgi:hypothetical protein
MNEEENREERPEEGRTKSSPEVNDTSEEQPVESTANYQTQTENMELHHHSNVEKKNFKEYFV